jgi:uncharacterized membrane protein HdeD (DUF308 family)
MKLNSYKNAARILTILGCIGLLIGLYIIIYILIALFEVSYLGEYGFLLLFFASLLIALSIFNIFLGTALKKHKNWARIFVLISSSFEFLSGVVFLFYSLFALAAGDSFSFPFTVTFVILLNVYLLWSLLTGWKE